MDNAERLAYDFLALQRALGDNFTSPMMGRASEVLLAPPTRLSDCALDYAVESLPVGERVRLQRLAKANGYRRPWLRH